MGSRLLPPGPCLTSRRGTGAARQPGPVAHRPLVPPVKTRAAAQTEADTTSTLNDSGPPSSSKGGNAATW
ncbi:hypothetical protein E2C01_043347 [Portunus trituberculatus]|uniref:Uncharacterized protein n=1 Tax=Portunus trituberculatus TaxID=210409 RepID=A0A5B7FSQ6_PORTR|nr:hypothetical protein [Portunus trituberculatus]